MKYSILSPFSSFYAGIANVSCNVPRLLNAETAFEAEKTGSVLRSMLRSQQKPVKLMHSTVQKFPKLGSMVFDLFVGTGTPAKDFLLENRHRKFVGCDMDSDSVEVMKPSLIKVFEEQLLNSKSDIEKEKSFFIAACASLGIWESNTSFQRKQARETDQNLYLAQVFPLHITQ